MDFESLVQKRDNAINKLAIILSNPIQRYQLFGTQFFLKQFDCKNLAYNPDKLRDAGVVITNNN